MKEVLVDINELTDSRELYQSKPHPFVWIFTYILLALIGTAVIWACFGKKEIVIKATGQVRPESGISTVRNIVSGEAENVNYKQGMTVKAGDILYIIKHDNLLVERQTQCNRLKELEKELKNLNRYRSSVSTRINSFDPEKESAYYEKVKKLLMDLKFSQTDTEYKTTKLKEEETVNSGQLQRNQEEIDCLKTYIDSLDENKNYFKRNSELEKQYSRKYEKFLISQTDIQRKFDQQANDIRSNSLEAIKQSLNEEKALLAAYQTLKRSVNDSRNYFASGDRYVSLYSDYEYKLTSLKNTYDEKKKIYDAYLALSGVAITQSELKDAENQMQKAEGEYTSYKGTFAADIEKNINDRQISVKELESRVSGTLDKQTLLSLNEKDRNNSIKALYLQERQDAADSIGKLTDTINSLRLNITLSKAELKTITDANGEGGDSPDYSLVERTKATEVVATDEKIKTVTDNMAEVSQSVKQLELDINNAIVRASVDGVVNVLSQVYKGDFVANGNNMLTIIPDENSAFKMQMTVSNKDIGEINAGDTVKYSFAALPYREYGQVAGKITSISKDAVNNETNGQSYYIVEATVPTAKLVSNSGKQGQIKVGMVCEAHVITKQKSFLRYFLEKINLLD
jgi:multidrug efflux pump subunit AcrA (membrane-fusion protein)